MNKRLLTITIICILCCPVVYFVWTCPKTQIQEQKILQYIAEGNSGAAESVLHKMAQKKLPCPKAFYKGMIAQTRGKFAESHLLFRAALKSPQENTESLFLDLCFGEMANAYFERKEKEYAAYLESAHRLGVSHPLLSFFDGLFFYMQEKYTDAASIWESYDVENTDAKGKWKTSVFNHLFPKNICGLYLAHSLLEKDDILNGRQILEREIHLAPKDDQFQELGTLFLGLSYLKEAHFVPLDQRGSYYQLARFYFEKSSKKFTLERRLISRHIQKEIEFLALHAPSAAQKKWGTDFIQILLAWKDDVALTQLSERLSSHIISKKDVLLCELLCQSFAETSFHNMITKHLLDHLSTKLKNRETLASTWETAETLSHHNKELAKEIAKLTREEIFDAISQDDEAFVLTRQYVLFWEKFNTSLQDRQQFGFDLFNLSKLLWHTEGQENKGLYLMEIAIGLESQLTTQIEKFLTNLYVEAENSNLIRRLAFIYEALEYFGINHQELATPSKIANYVADAEYLYCARNYGSSKIQAGWVLKLDPSNQQAIRLVGLSSFHLGDYNQAYLALNQLSNPDEYAHKALILSQVYSIENEKHLVQNDNSNSFSEDE